MRCALVLASLVAAGVASAQPVDSLYCQRDQALAVRGAVGGALTFDFSLWTPEGQYLGIRGDAAPQGSGWVFTSGLDSADPAQHCAVRLTLSAGGVRFETAENARCEAMGGYGASLYQPLTFPASSRVGGFAPVGAEDPVPPGC